MYFSYFVDSNRAHLWKDGWYIEDGLLGLDGHEAKKLKHFYWQVEVEFHLLKGGGRYIGLVMEAY